MTLAVVGVVWLYWELESLLGLWQGYRGLFDRYPYWVPRSLRSVLEIALILAAVCLLHRLGPALGLRELGWRGPARRAFGVMSLAVAPMWLVFALTTPANPDVSVPAALYLAFLSPLAEETAFRGFFFGQLWLRAGWGLWPALAVSSAVFGYAHAESADSLSEATGLFLLTGFGAAVFAWLFARWRTLAAPLALHALMNLAWSVWSVGDSALAGWMPLCLQIGTAALAVVLTFRATHRRPPANGPR